MQEVQGITARYLAYFEGTVSPSLRVSQTVFIHVSVIKIYQLLFDLLVIKMYLCVRYNKLIVECVPKYGTL